MSPSFNFNFNCFLQCRGRRSRSASPVRDPGRNGQTVRFLFILLQLLTKLKRLFQQQNHSYGLRQRRRTPVRAVSPNLAESDDDEWDDDFELSESDLEDEEEQDPVDDTFEDGTAEEWEEEPEEEPNGDGKNKNGLPVSCYPSPSLSNLTFFFNADRSINPTRKSVQSNDSHAFLSSRLASEANAGASKLGSSTPLEELTTKSKISARTPTLSPFPTRLPTLPTSRTKKQRSRSLSTFASN